MKVIVSDTPSLIVLEGLSAFELLAKVFDSYQKTKEFDAALQKEAQAFEALGQKTQ